MPLDRIWAWLQPPADWRTPGPSWRRRTKGALQFIIAVAVVGTLIYRIGPRDIAGTFAGVRPGLVIIAALIVPVDVVVRSFNWRLLLRIRGLEVPFRHVLYSYLVGGVFGAVIPSSLGPDTARTFLIARRAVGRRAEAASSVVVLNLVSLWSLCGIAFVAAVALTLLLGPSPLTAAILLVSAGGIVSVPATMFIARRLRPGAVQGHRLLEQLWNAGCIMASYLSARRQLAAVAMLSVVGFGLKILMACTVAAALRLDIPFHYFVIMLPPILLSRLVPLSFSGFGAEQGFFIYFFGALGVPAAHAFAVSVMLSTISLLFLILCGLAYMIAGATQTLSRMQAPEGDLGRHQHPSP